MSRPSEKKKLETLNCIGHLENVTILEKISIQTIQPSGEINGSKISVMKVHCQNEMDEILNGSGNQDKLVTNNLTWTLCELIEISLYN